MYIYIGIEKIDNNQTLDSNNEEKDKVKLANVLFQEISKNQ